MKSSIDLNKLKLKDLLKGLCANPTPFKLLATFDENDSVEDALKLFKKTNSKRKVIGIRTKSNGIFHLGENEMRSIIDAIKARS